MASRDVGPCCHPDHGLYFSNTKGDRVSDDRMIGPGMHEHAADEALPDRPDHASVFALLAIASAINRLADAVNDFVATQQ
jgi:hypothetical protein